jgi:hypothetical protein
MASDIKIGRVRPRRKAARSEAYVTLRTDIGTDRVADVEAKYPFESKTGIKPTATKCAASADGYRAKKYLVDVLRFRHYFTRRFWSSRASPGPTCRESKNFAPAFKVKMVFGPRFTTIA